MEETVSAANANRRFSRLLRAVREGHSYVVTSHGKPVAKIVPIGKHDELAAETRTTLLSRLLSERLAEIGPWTRDELYGDVE